MDMTKGQYRVGVGFNPSGSDIVARIKTAAAALIDLIDEIPPEAGPLTTGIANAERARLRALAQTAVEEAAMWAVKAATKGNPE
jgi:hypothetical protein